MTHCITARLISYHGRHAWVETEDASRHLCVFKGRDLIPSANDQVVLDLSQPSPVITQILERRNIVMRSEAHRSKLIAANIDQAVIVLSGAPLFSDELLARMICACAAQNIAGVLVMNKSDLVAETERALAQASWFEQCCSLLGWKTVKTCAAPPAQETRALEELICGKTSLIMGQSGMGKSSLLNALVPGFGAQTREISEALQTGKHTTTAATVVRHSPMTWLIDTPGFQRFGLHHLSIEQIALGFPEWRSLHDQHGSCRFANCRHRNEPDCTIELACRNDPALAHRRRQWLELISGHQKLDHL